MREMQYFLFRTIKKIKHFLDIKRLTEFPFLWSNIFDIPWHNNDVTNKYFPFNTEFVILIN